MKKVITYGTYDLLHHGHIKLLERAKALGDYLIVGVTAEDFDKARGKINVRQSLMERVAAVEATGIADEIIIEEYEGQKIDDIKRYDVDVFTVGSDWVGYFDYLNNYCDVVYLDRTQGVSSTDLRSESGQYTVGFIGNSRFVIKYINELRYVNGMIGVAICSTNVDVCNAAKESGLMCCSSFNELCELVDVAYIASPPAQHEEHIESALMAGKHVLCESPIALSVKAFDRLSVLANEKNLVLMDGIKTAYSMAYHRLKLLVKSGQIGSVLSVECACTSLKKMNNVDANTDWNSICEWGPTALLPVFQLLDNHNYQSEITSKLIDGYDNYDVFSKIDLFFDNSVASVTVGKGIKSEGDLVISGSRGYVYVPAPWWKTDYYEVRFEDPANNKRYFYELSGEGIRYEFVCLYRAISKNDRSIYLEKDTSRAIISVIEKFYAEERRELLPLFSRQES